MRILKNLFLPTEENGLTPQVLKPEAFFLYLLLAILGLVYPAYLRNSQLAALSVPFKAYSMIELVNASRESMGLSKLSESTSLSKAAEDKLKDIFEKQYFAHVSPDSKTPWDFIRARSYVYTAAGENLALDFSNAADAHAGLMNSASHRENILNPSYTEMGVAVAQGEFQGKPSVVVVEFFGKPKPVIEASKKTGPTSTQATKPVKNIEPNKENLEKAVTASVVANTPTSTPSEIGLAGENKPESKESLSTPIKLETKPALAKTFLQTYASQIIRIAAIFLISFILLGISFMETRMGIVPGRILANSSLMIVLLSYLAITGGGNLLIPIILPTAFDVFSVE